MSTFAFAPLQKRTNDLLVKFGTGITLTVTSSGGFSLTTGTYVSASTTSYACTGVFSSYKRQDIDGSLIQATDKLLLLSAYELDVTPSLMDKIYYGGIPYQILSIEEIKPADTTVLYKVQLRK